MQSGSSLHTEDHPRKKIRKGTRSCWECKHRKVRCRFASKDDSTCNECLARGSTCRSQEYPEDGRDCDKGPLGERVGRVEHLLEKLLHKVGGLEEDERQIAAEALESLGNHTLTPSSMTPNACENAPVLSLFDNAVFGRRGIDEAPTTPSTALRASATSSSNVGTPSNQLLPKLEKLRRELLANFPSQRVIDKLSGASSGWWLIRKQYLQDQRDSLGALPVESLSRCHPTVIASALLCIAISIQQLPPSFDTRSLQLPSSASQLMHQYVTLVSASITSDDEMLSSIEGLECLVLQGVLHNNAGKLRSAWLCYRRALSIAQLIGLHRDASQWHRKPDPATIQRVKGIWWHIVQADRYLALTLGLPYGVSDSACVSNSQDQDQPLSMEDFYMRKLSTIAGYIIDRNQSSPRVSDAMVCSTQTIDAELNTLATQVPASWWDLPADIPRGRTKEGVTCYARLMAQLWHHQLAALLHLPLMLHAATEQRYEYSRLSCLKASRNMIKCYEAMRHVTEGSFCCKSLDFQAFTAAVTLLLNLLGPEKGYDAATGSGPDNVPTQDWRAVDSVTKTLEYLTSAQSDQVATQALRVLRVLRGVDLAEEGGEPGEARLVIPYFGTICIERGRMGSLVAQGQQQQQPLPPNTSSQSNSNGSSNNNKNHTNSMNPSVNVAPPETSQLVPFQHDVAATSKHLSVHSHTGNFFPSLGPDPEQLSDDWLFDGLDNLPSQNLFTSDLDADWGFGFERLATPPPPPPPPPS